jgi:hypothetical protein
MTNKFERELEKFAKSKHDGHDEVMKKFEQWSKNLEDHFKKIDQTNQQFLKEVEGKLGYMNQWFAKKEKQLEKLLRFLQ